MKVTVIRNISRIDQRKSLFSIVFLIIELGKDENTTQNNFIEHPRRNWG
tara:strand:- start:76 stop:222 length:147 start_codon:yes stop_codon:yes gene_type:complete